MQHNKYGYVCSTETKIFSGLDKWLKQKKQAERRPKRRRFLYANRTQTWRADNVQVKSSSGHR